MERKIDNFIQDIKDAIEGEIEVYDGYEPEGEKEDTISLDLSFPGGYSAVVNIELSVSTWLDKGTYDIPPYVSGIIYWKAKDYNLWTEGYEYEEEGELDLSGKFTW